MFQSLCKNLERTESKKWLNETLEILMKVFDLYAKFRLTIFTLKGASSGRTEGGVQKVESYN